MTVRFFLLLLVVAGWVSGCGRSGAEGLPVDPSPPVVVTPTPPPAATPLPAVAATATIPPLDLDAPPPAPETLRWEAVEGVAGLRRLAAMPSARLMAAEASPDGRWWVAQVVSERVEMNPRTHLYLLDAAGENHRLLAEDGYSGQRQWLWMADGSLLWVADGTVLAAAPLEASPRPYEIPDTAREIYDGGGMVLVAGDAALWRLDPATGDGERVEGIAGPFNSVAGGAIGVAPDGQEATFFIAGQLYRVPMTLGAPAELLTSFDFPGRGGSLFPARPLAGGAYWLSGEMAILEEGTMPVPVLVDRRDNSLVPVATFIGGEQPSQIQLSPGGRWLALAVDDVDKSGPRQVTVLAAPDLAPAHEIEARNIVGWDGESGLYLTTAAPALVRLDLASGDRTPLVDLPPGQVDQLQVAGGWIFVIHGSDLDLYDLRGHHRARLALLGPGTRLHVGADGVLLAHGAGGAPLWHYGWATR